MNDFWVSDLGEITGNANDAFAKSFTHIPDNTMALARIDTFANAEFNGNKYLSIDWMIVEGDFKGQKVNQKLKVYGDPRDKDPARTRHRALNMLKLIYQLYNAKPRHAGAPEDADLSIFIGKNAGIKIRETEPNDHGKQYNWVAEIHEAKGFKCETGVSLVFNHVPSAKQSPVDSAFSRQTSFESAVLDDGIPF